ncbi:unnamed protein product [marine sediment metagenome]|uniref:Uncharacterized protein n=1 Tax=marine sediment metagenome TaxID=412755 RepID=X0TD99_9ZZZZ
MVNIQEQFQWVLNFFVFRESNIKNIHGSIFYLAKWGLSPEYLYKVPLNIFYYYVKLYNKREQDSEFERMKQEAENAKNNRPEPKPSGAVISKD